MSPAKKTPAKVSVKKATSPIITAAKAPARLRVAFIGTGGICVMHLEAYSRLPEFEVVASCDIKPERNAWFVQQPGMQNVRTYLDYNEMLKKEKLDVVDVCTPNGVHAEATIAALKAGCHVMVEKPMGMNPEECAKMCAAAKKAGKILGVGFQFRYNSSTQMCRRAFDAGVLGDVLVVKVQAMRRRGVPNWGVFGQKELQGGGPMIDIGVHMIECSHYAVGQPVPVAATGMTWTYLGDKPSQVVSCWPNWDYKNYTVEDLCVGQVRFANGMLMQIESAFCSHIETNEYLNWQVLGTKGGFDFKNATLYHDLAGTMVNSKAGWLPTQEDTYPAMFYHKLKAFGDAIRFGKPLTADGEEGLAVQKIINGLYSSAEQGGKEFLIK
jgi:predicted dehydrogenase